jgi:hypothetical protein
MNSNNKLRNAVRLGLVIGVSARAWGAAPGFMAQGVDDDALLE